MFIQVIAFKLSKLFHLSLVISINLVQNENNNKLPILFKQVADIFIKLSVGNH
jgi:hypothetical protein